MENCLNFKIEKIEIDRINEISDILIKKAEYLNSINKKMWDISRLSKNELLKQYKDPLLFLVYDDNRVVGCFLLIEKDEKNWPESHNDKTYYLHRLAVKTEYSGLGYSDKIISWIKNYAKENKKDFIRIVFDKKRKYLDQLYKSNGFIEVGKYEMRPGLMLAKAEYKIKN